jgi:hypothetical protein
MFAEHGPAIQEEYSMGGWNRWYHCKSSTFGTWLPGDERGFRTRKHREHVEGDNRNPPAAGMYAQRNAIVRARLTRPAVVLTAQQRDLTLAEVVDSLRRHDVEIIAMCASATHMHVLGRFLLIGRKTLVNEHGLRTSLWTIRCAM